MDIQSLSRTYTVRALDEADLPALLALCQGNPLFYRHCPPPPSVESLRADMTALPSRKTMEDKYYLGFWRDGALAAVLDLILRYPNEHTAFIGFFMLDAALQGRGEGSRIVGDILRALSREFTAVRLAYVKTNPQSKRFWLKNGFLPTELVLHMDAYDVVVLERPLP